MKLDETFSSVLPGLYRRQGAPTKEAALRSAKDSSKGSFSSTTNVTMSYALVKIAQVFKVSVTNLASPRITHITSHHQRHITSHHISSPRIMAYQYTISFTTALPEPYTGN